MSTYKLNPTYYRVTWDQTFSTDYTGLTGTQAGGLDSVTPFEYNNRVSITGTISITPPTITLDGDTPFADADSLFINGYEIVFTSTDNLYVILERINMASIVTNVIAHNGVDETYVTITNASGYEGSYIQLAEGTGALAKLGFTPGSYSFHPCVVGDVFGGFTNGDTFTINGVTVTMTTASGLDADGTVATINALTYVTGVVAVRAAGTIQLASVNGQPWTTGGANATKLGFPAGIYGGSPSTLEQSTNKALANMRWLMVINQLEMFSTPFMLNDVLGTGNFDGSDELNTFSFTVGYERPDQISVVETEGEPNPGNILTGAAAIKRAVARGLIATYKGNTNLFDPTITTKGSYAVRPNSVRVTTLTATGIDTLANIATIEGNLSVTMIAYA